MLFLNGEHFAQYYRTSEIYPSSNGVHSRMIIEALKRFYTYNGEEKRETDADARWSRPRTRNESDGLAIIIVKRTEQAEV